MNETISINEAKHDQIEMIDKKKQAKRFHFIGRTKYYKEKNRKYYQESKDKNTKKRNCCSTKNCSKR